MTLSVDDFEAFHHGVHGRSPFDWQSRLLRQIIVDHAWPGVLSLPTGAGKTTCLDIALFALALDAAAKPHERWCPRRIAMVVDRRIVVDQVAERGRKLLGALLAKDAASVVQEVAHALRSLSREEREPLGVFTLRGGMPKDDGWARTPDQPLILASTVDQIGSRLLMQGYGVTNGMKPVHAGLLANDTLLLLDEVHLSRPFADTLHALAQLRVRFGANTAVRSRFCHAFLSATPGATRGTPFELATEEQKIDSPLGRRLHVRKPARLVDVSGRRALEKRCVDEAAAVLKAHDVVAVVVNRVASAAVVARNLREVAGDADVVLLTGRMRPLDRDDVLHDLRGRVMTGRDRGAVDKKLVVVATQCVEAGADFDFDALVTECASLDSLKQRFGRVDRLGEYEKAEGVIIRDKDNAKPDPVYGDALVKTAAWLKRKLDKKKKIDFGIAHLPAPEDVVELTPPHAPAPVLLPAYLDLWMQTSPPPASSPEVSLWLHGPRDAPPDVQVVWRADLSSADLEHVERATEVATQIVASVRPSSLEAISLPFGLARAWLTGEKTLEPDVGDVEGAQVALPPESRSPRRALRWRGDDSEILGGSDDLRLRPGDTIVVPAEYGGIRDGCFDPSATDEVPDLAERAALFGRGQPTLRRHPRVLGARQLGLALPDDDDDVAARLLELAATADGWKQEWLQRLARSRSRTSIVVTGRDDRRWTVLRAKRVPVGELRRFLRAEQTLENGTELTTDDDDSFHAGRSVPLAEHSRDVEAFARGYACAAGLADDLVNDIALAGWLHDVGKADRRFQVLLRGGSDLGFFKDETPWAKSGMAPGERAAHLAAQKKSGYPRRARHEVQSVAMIEAHLDVIKTRARDLDLVLHLVATHHGHCRPFAPEVDDLEPVEVTLREHRSEAFGVIDFDATSSANRLHHLDSSLAERFWRLVEKYGWLELCWLESLLRLADHRASETEQES